MSKTKKMKRTRPVKQVTYKVAIYGEKVPHQQALTMTEAHLAALNMTIEDMQDMLSDYDSRVAYNKEHPERPYELLDISPQVARVIYKTKNFKQGDIRGKSN